MRGGIARRHRYLRINNKVREFHHD